MKSKRFNEKPDGSGVRMGPSIADKQAAEQLKTCRTGLAFPLKGSGLCFAVAYPWAVSHGKPRLFVEIGVVTSAPVSRRELMRYAAREPAECENMASQ
ncbi:hypothetical protein [Mesorhizobium sp. M1E.F.Ca.ET.063.01.1.1]|uniref:hypothetical protein n=1 Tax=Mesorhizobium sp. M1E.F.Ca.ET.063.01.1.1 TaxID=2496750 RepID=UPI001AECA0BD|nr:hypothetical protein [Mesorhizobium sp. M1E.F.Ca.ET.063.01.1.1]